MKTVQTFFSTDSLVKAEKREGYTNRDTTKITYSARHNNGITTLETIIRLTVEHRFKTQRVKFDLDFGDLEADDSEKALDKLADWLIRTGIAIKARKPAENSETIY